MKSITKMQVGNELFDIKDQTAREHLVEIKDGNTPPESVDNRLWIKPRREVSYTVPEYSEFQAVAEIVDELNVPIITEDEIDAICRGGDY